MLSLPNITTCILIAATAGILSAKPDDKEITLTPSTPNQSVDFDPALFPGETVNLTIHIEDGEANDKKFTLEGNPKVEIQNELSLWTRKGDQESKIKFEFEALNIGHENEKLFVSVAATWKTPTSGGGGSAAPEKIEGLATGTAYTKRHVFTWEYEERLDFADGESFISFTVSASENGAFYDLAAYEIGGPQGWNVPQRADLHIHGKVSTEIASKGQLGIHYNNILQGTSPDEIAFANFDLAIAKHGNSENLAEDRLPHNQVANPPHEMNPGAIVIAPIASEKEGEANLTPGKRTKLTIKGNSPAIDGGTYTLSAANNLTKLKIYEAEEGGEPIELPKTYEANQLNEPVTLYVGAKVFGAGDMPQTDKLTLKYQLPLLADAAPHELKDEVMATSTTIEVIELHPLLVDEEGNDVEGSDKPRWDLPLTPFVEENPYANKIAHRELKVRVGGPAMADKKVTWTLGELPGANPAAIRGDWAQSPDHKNGFEKSSVYGDNGYKDSGTGKATVATTMVDSDGNTAIRINIPPIGLNQVRINITIEGMDVPYNLIDMEVPAVVIIDPGHGGDDSGTVANSDETVKEYNLTTFYGNSLRDSLKDKYKSEMRNLRVVMTRTTEDKTVQLIYRAPFAKNNGADVFVSIHFNNAGNYEGTNNPNTTTRGTETFVERTPGNHNLNEDGNLAGELQASAYKAVKSQDSNASHRPTYKENQVLDENENTILGVKTAGFAVTKDGISNNGNTEKFKPVKACLVEVEFLSNAAATESVRIPGVTGEAIRDAFSSSASSEIYNHIINQP
jgi:N-acetylmuramoyl-L-alanine amidase